MENSLLVVVPWWTWYVGEWTYLPFVLPLFLFSLPSSVPSGQPRKTLMEPDWPSDSDTLVLWVSSGSTLCPCSITSRMLTVGASYTDEAVSTSNTCSLWQMGRNPKKRRRWYGSTVDITWFLTLKRCSCCVTRHFLFIYFFASNTSKKESIFSQDQQ